MPRYEYECERCGHKFEMQMHMGDPNPPCPNEVTVTDPRGNPLYEVGHGDKPMTETCGGPTRRLISASNFHLVGGGWASDGYSGGKS